MKIAKILSSTTVLFLVFFTALLFAQDGVTKDAALSVAGFEGKVQVKIAPSPDWIDATVGQVLNQNDAIRTGEDGQAMLRFSDKSTVALKPKTELVIEELVWSATARKAGLNMPSGELRAIIKKLDAPSDFKVKTPAAICGARGTVFYILSTPTETRVFVTEGAVDFSSPVSGNSYVVVESMQAIAQISGTITEPRELTGAEKDEVLAGWSGVVAEPYTEPGGEDQGGTGDEGFNTQSGTPENPSQDNKGQQDGPISPI